MLEKSNVVESILSVELADPTTNILPGSIIERALKLGFNTIESLVFLTCRELQPSEDLNKMSIIDEHKTPPNPPPSTYLALTSWFETWHNKLMVATSMEALPNPRKRLTVITALVQPLLHTDALSQALSGRALVQSRVDQVSSRPIALRHVVSGRSRSAVLSVPADLPAHPGRRSCQMDFLVTDWLGSMKRVADCVSVDACHCRPTRRVDACMLAR
eukprot:1211555-Amphidinium_carterae.4